MEVMRGKVLVESILRKFIHFKKKLFIETWFCKRKDDEIH